MTEKRKSSFLFVCLFVLVVNPLIFQFPEKEQKRIGTGDEEECWQKSGEASPRSLDVHEPGCGCHCRCSSTILKVPWEGCLGKTRYLEEGFQI